jgi:hypothetical protein
VKFMVYGWVPAINGHAGLGPVTSDVDVSMGDVIKHADLVESVVPVDIEARVGNWGFLPICCMPGWRTNSAPGQMAA